MGLELNFVTSSSSATTINKGNSVPPWVDDYDNRYQGNAYYYYNKVDNTVYIQYGSPTSEWATNKFYIYTVSTQNVEEKTNGVIDVDVTVQLKRYVSRRAPAWSYSSDIRVRHDFYFNDTNFHTFTGITKDLFTVGEKSPVSFHLTLEPEEKSNTTAIKVVSDYLDDTFDDEEIYVGFQLVNTNKKIVNYIPMAIRKSGSFKSLNKNSGFIKIRKSGNWKDKSQENLRTKGEVNKGKNRIRKSGKWKQQGDF